MQGSIGLVGHGGDRAQVSKAYCCLVIAGRWSDYVLAGVGMVGQRKAGFGRNDGLGRNRGLRERLRRLDGVNRMMEG
jgi:hypothetical protein